MSIEQSEDKAQQNVEAEESRSSEPSSEPLLPNWRLVLLSISLCVGLFMSFLDSSIISTVLFTIGEDFHALSTINWIALAYTLSNVGCAVLFTSIGDITGRKNAYIAASIIFYSFSIGCGFAQSLNQLIAFRALQGLGGAGLYSLAMVIFPEISPPGMKKWIGAAVGMVVAVSGVLGPVLGGTISHYTTWRWIFWMNAPFGVVALSIFVIAWPKANQLHHPERRNIRELDIIGSILLLAASVLVVLAFQESGVHTNAFGTALFIAPLAVGCASVVLLVCWETIINRSFRYTISAIFPSSLMKRRVYIAGALTTLFTSFPYFIVIYNTPLHFQVVNGKNSLTAGIGLLPLLASTATGSMLSGAISGKKNLLFYTLTVGSCLLTLGCGLLSTIAGGVRVDPKIYGFLVLVGLGFGLTVSTTSMLAAVECELKDHAVAQGIVAQARVLGGSFGIAASTVIRGVTERKELAGIISISQLTSLDISKLDHTQIMAVQKAYSDSFSKMFRISAIVSGKSILFALGSFTMNPVSLEEKGQIQVAAEKERLRLKAENARNDRLHDVEFGVVSPEQVTKSMKRNEVLEV